MHRRNFLIGAATLLAAPALASEEIHIEAEDGEDITYKLRAAFESNAKRIVLPYGQFFISQTVYPKRGQILEGQGSSTISVDFWHTAKTVLIWDGKFEGIMFGLINSRGFQARKFAVDGNGLDPIIFYARKIDQRNDRVTNMTFEDLFLHEVGHGWYMGSSAWGCYWHRCIVENFTHCAYRLIGPNGFSSFVRCEALDGNNWRARDVIIGEKDHSSSIGFTHCRFETHVVKRRYALEVSNVSGLSFMNCHFEGRVKKAFIYLKNVEGVAFGNRSEHKISRGCCLYQQGNG